MTLPYKYRFQRQKEMAEINTEYYESIVKLPPPDTVRREPRTGGIVFSLPCQHRWSVVCKEILQ